MKTILQYGDTTPYVMLQFQLGHRHGVSESEYPLIRVIGRGPPDARQGERGDPWSVGRGKPAAWGFIELQSYE